MNAQIQCFEDLIAWQKVRALTAEIYRASGTGDFAKDYGLKGQIRRAAVSTMSNIAEGFERGGPAEFHRFLSIAKGSGGELRSQLYVALDVGYLKHERFDALLAQAQEVNRVVGGLRISVGRKRG